MHHLVRVVDYIDQEDQEVLECLREELPPLYLFLWGVVSVRVLMRLWSADIVDFVEQEGKGKRDCLGYLLLHLVVVLLVLAPPILRDNQ